jgi:N-acetylglucosaminyldiphosphoundecaprenol N-acetyl-beta-D-mannosaminyltransferase
MKREVLGVKIDDVSKDEALKIIDGWLLVTRHQPLVSHIVVTPGPEFILTAQDDKDFKEILNSADLAIAESFGLQLLCGFKNRIPGVDMVWELCRLAEEKKLTVGFLGGKTGVAKKAAEKLQAKFPKLKVGFAIDGNDADAVIAERDRLRPCDILLVGLGHPKQEKLLWKLKNDKSSFQVGMGVGGSFDLISGEILRAPVVVQKIGLEWLWRMVTKQDHVKRVFRATFLFAFKVLFK